MRAIFAAIKGLFRSEPIGPQPISSIDQLVVKIFGYFSKHLSDNWTSFSAYCKFDDESEQIFVEYVNSSGDLIKPHDWPEATAMVDAVEDMRQLAKAASFSGEPVTHIQLNIASDGQFENLLGYGPVDWMKVWPDDTSASRYTYENG